MILTQHYLSKVWTWAGKRGYVRSSAPRARAADGRRQFHLDSQGWGQLQTSDTLHAGVPSLMPTFGWRAAKSAAQGFASPLALACWLLLIFLPLGAWALPSAAHPPHTLELQIDAPEADVVQAVQAVSQDPILYGTYSYEKEKILVGAHPAEASRFFGKWDGPGKVFYKVDDNVLAPRYFAETGDIGTITVRYVVHGVNPTQTDVRIDAVFVDARHGVHWSEGGVESAEYGAVQQQIRQLQSLRRQPQGNESSSRSSSSASGRQEYGEATPVSTATGAVSAEQELEQRVSSLRHQVERRVKADGAQLKSAPFQSATTVEKLPANAEVLLLIVTPYWYGIETDNGHHGWVHHSQLEPLP